MIHELETFAATHNLPLGDRDIDEYSTDALQSARGAISKQRRLMTEASTVKDEAHPAIILRKAISQS